LESAKGAIFQCSKATKVVLIICFLGKSFNRGPGKSIVCQQHCKPGN
jgi:hypothetical protein